MTSLMKLVVLLQLLIVYVSFGAAQSGCSSTLTPTNSVKPSVASGFRAQLVATGLSKPRSIEFDNAGNLLVVESGSGSLTALTFRDGGGTCLHVESSKAIVNNSNLNHGLALSEDGATLFASSSDTAWSWTYDPLNGFTTDKKTVVSGMNTDDHTTRTLLVPRKVQNALVVSRGSTSNIDLLAANISTGHSQIKSFNLANIPTNGRDFDSEGARLGWGLRNSVGVAEHPDTGGIYSVENSADEITRDGKDVHENNPAEEMNFNGYLNGTQTAQQGKNINGGNGKNDSFCSEQVPPRLAFQAHMAPLDIKFNNSGSEAWVSFHGSWDRTNPVGYKVSMIQFANGEPVAAPTSNSAAMDVFANQDNSGCPDHCFRPVGMAFDKFGRLFMASDATGEIYVIQRDVSASGTPSSSASATSASSSSTSTSSSSGGIVGGTLPGASKYVTALTLAALWVLQ
ncbi:MAG: hypothetical protein Q9227_008573 [Pyrenula ochraceoflavens]